MLSIRVVWIKASSGNFGVFICFLSLPMQVEEYFAWIIVHVVVLTHSLTYASDSGERR